MQARLGSLAKKDEIDRLVIEVFFAKQLTTHCAAYKQFLFVVYTL